MRNIHRVANIAVICIVFALTLLSITFRHRQHNIVLKDIGAGLFWGLGSDPLFDPEETGGEYDAGGDSDDGLQRMADDALKLCDEVMKEPDTWPDKVKAAVPNPVRHCVHRVIPSEYTKYTNTIAGRNDWDSKPRSVVLQTMVHALRPTTDGIMENGKIVSVPTYDRS
mmetsp:Transcript_320/g.648  ORF Transcript_320/g.648 Transcript_320/m.648 type:complete len:168 (-) Transcript_320:453-956(-)